MALYSFSNTPSKRPILLYRRTDRILDESKPSAIEVHMQVHLPRHSFGLESSDVLLSVLIELPPADAPLATDGSSGGVVGADQPLPHLLLVHLDVVRQVRCRGKPLNAALLQVTFEPFLQDHSSLLTSDVAKKDSLTTNFFSKLTRRRSAILACFSLYL